MIVASHDNRMLSPVPRSMSLIRQCWTYLTLREPIIVYPTSIMLVYEPKLRDSTDHNIAERDGLKRLNIKGKISGQIHPKAKMVRCFALDNEMCIPNSLMSFRHPDCYKGGKQHGYKTDPKIGAELVWVLQPVLAGSLKIPVMI